MANDSACNGALPAFSAGEVGQPAGGLSKREWMAAICLQGILANKSIHKYTLWSATQSAIMYADQLLAGLECMEQEPGALPRPDTYPLKASTSA